MLKNSSFKCNYFSSVRLFQQRKLHPGTIRDTNSNSMLN